MGKYEKFLVKKPVYEVSAAKKITGRQHPTMTFMSSDLVPENDVYLEFGWVWDVPQPNPHIHEHSHEYDEIVLHIGSDPNNPEDLGAEIEFVVGGEPLKIDKTAALFIPKGVKHGPLTWKRVDRPHIQMAIVLGGGVLSKAAPGGDTGT